MLQPLVEPDRNKNKATFKKMLGSKNPKYMKRTVGLIINWERETNSKKIYHIHGTNDHTIPMKGLSSSDFVIMGGSHMMTLTSPVEISLALNQILTN